MAKYEPDLLNHCAKTHGMREANHFECRHQLKLADQANRPEMARWRHRQSKLLKSGRRL